MPITLTCEFFAYLESAGVSGAIHTFAAISKSINRLRTSMSGTDNVIRGSHDIAIPKISVQDSSGTHVTHDIADITEWDHDASELSVMYDRNDLLELYLLMFVLFIPMAFSRRGIELAQLFQHKDTY